MNILLLKPLMCMIRITQSQAPHVLMKAMQSTSRPAAGQAFPDTHLMACHLHCSGATAAWPAIHVTAAWLRCTVSKFDAHFTSTPRGGMGVYTTVL